MCQKYEHSIQISKTKDVFKFTAYREVTMPIFLIFVILFALWVKYEIGKNSKMESNANTDFLERERLANFTRKADITKLNYLSIPLRELPFMGKYENAAASYLPSSDISSLTKNEILDCEKNIIALSNKKILNLGGLSNTDIKMEYGVANLQILMQYDDNFSKLSRILAKWGKLLFDAGELAASEKVLSYAVSCGADIEDVFITLAKIYKQTGNELGISSLVDACTCFDELRREKIIEQITSI